MGPRRWDAAAPAPTMAPMKAPNLHNRLYIAEASAAIRARIADVLRGLPDVRIVGEASEAQQALREIAALRPDSVLLDLELGGSTGTRILEAIRGQAPEAALVILTNLAEPQYRRACERAGADGFLDKTNEFERLPGVIAGLAARRDHH